MPFSFIEIEQHKSRAISFLFAFILVFYFAAAYMILLILENTLFQSWGDARPAGFIFPPIDHTLAALILAFIVGFFHWSMSTANLIEKISSGIGAVGLDEKDIYHQYFKNIVDEVSVAIGSRSLEAMVIPSAYMNAFALEDFSGRAVVGVTEGLLSKLSRPQIEAVVGHEAGHIAGGDCLSTTVTCCLGEIYDETFSKLAAGLRGARGRAAGLLVLFFAVIAVMRFLSSLIRFFISRQREYRADAVSVRLTRDPLSLAEALKLISAGWRGAGMAGDKVESIFIVKPNYSSLDETQGLFSDIFSTHPPVKNRIDILLNMAHLDNRSLEEKLKNFKRVSPVASAELSMPSAAQVDGEWFVYLNQSWLGPFALRDMLKIEGFKPETWVRRQGQALVKPAYEMPQLLDLFKDKEDQASPDCPRCKASLTQVFYEGVPVLKCPYCQGVFVESDKVSRILIRQDKTVAPQTLRLAESIMADAQKLRGGLKRVSLSNAWILECPKCARKMHRQFFVYSYPVEIDRCSSCGGIWFDKDELDVLEYIYEHKERFFEGKDF